MPGGDHCAVWGCDNDRRYPEKQKVLPLVGILRFYSPKNKKDVLSWARAINRDQFKVTKGTERSPQITLSKVIESPNVLHQHCKWEGTRLQRSGLQKTKKKSRKRKQSDRVPTKKVPFVDDESLFGENIDFESRPASSCTTEYIHSFCPSSRDLAVLGMFLHRVRSEKKRLKNLRIFLSQTRT